MTIPGIIHAQVAFISPLPFGILQVHGDHADLRLWVAVQGYSTFSIKLSSDIDTSSLQSGWSSVTVRNDTVDTLITVPKSLRNYSIYWRTGLAANDTGGMISGLTPGHIIGIAGQSNAQGFTWEMIVPAEGDIRMLPRNDSTWVPAHEPTGGAGGGPWIVMANELYQRIGDTLPIGIVNAAIGSTALTTTSLSEPIWRRNPNNPEDTSLYGKALRLFRSAGSELECLGWIQGEGDAGYMPNPNIYRVAFANLMEGFHEDLTDTFPIFHLQIGGDNGAATDNWPAVREAERILPPSILVGTALGRSVDDGLHYSPPTMTAVGQMFAGALLKERYGISTPMYPPLMPDSNAVLDSITDGSIVGHYCFSVRWFRNNLPTQIALLNPVQYFALQKDGSMMDTSQVWARISPSDPTRILIGLRNDSITLNHDWRVTYDATSESDRAPLATVDPASGDTIFATAFYELPVRLPPGTQDGVKEFNVQFVEPNPTMNAINCYILAFKHETMTVELLDNLGAVLRSEMAVLEEGVQDIPISTDGLSSGNYWIELRDENGNESLEKAIVVH